MDNSDQNVRRWQIFMCQSGSVHIHYGTGSLHITKDDFRGLAEDLHTVAQSIRTGDEESKRPPHGGPLH